MMSRVLLALSSIVLSVDCDKDSYKRDFVSSTLNTAPLLRIHNKIIPFITQYREAVSKTAELINRYLEDPSLSYVTEPWETDGDPLRTYHLIRRTYFDFNKIIDSIRSIRSLDPLLEIENLRSQNLLPDADDFSRITKAMIRLQRMYRLNPLTLINGHLTDQIILPVTLSARDCLILGKAAEKTKKDYGSRNKVLEATFWYSAGLSLIQAGDDVMREKLQTRLLRIQSEVSIDDYLTDTESVPLMNSSLYWHQTMHNYRRLCRGDHLRVSSYFPDLNTISIKQPASLDANCRCHLRRGPHPYLKLRPLKLEVMSFRPYLVLIHDIVGQRDMDFIKSEALPKMRPSTHESGNGNAVSDVRISVTGWLGDHKTWRLNRRLEVFTGMGTRIKFGEAEDYQVLNYGVGGHYEPHHDYSPNDHWRRPDTGPRIATLMLYLSDVEAGGATVFPYLGVNIFPRKGMAAFWFNLGGNGEGEPLTLHGACPVLYGNKWATNKWYLRNAQMFKFPCPKQQHHTFRHL